MARAVQVRYTLANGTKAATLVDVHRAGVLAAELLANPNVADIEARVGHGPYSPMLPFRKLLTFGEHLYAARQRIDALVAFTS